jgi:plastocyanin
MNRPRWDALLLTVAAWLVLGSVPAWGGEIQGQVVLAGSIPPPRKLPITIDQYVCGTEQVAGDLVVSAAGEVRNAVVWLDNPPPGAPSAALASSTPMDQKECVFTPRIVLVRAPGTVEFLNSDRLLHNLHSVSKDNPSFNRTQPKGRTIPITFAKPEMVRIDCDLHSWMRGWVVVAPHAFHAITDGQGRFRFDQVPAGEYTLKLWHERLGEVSRTVKVVDEPATPVTIQLRSR